MSEKQKNIQERRVLIGQLMQEGYNSSRSIAKALKKHGVDLSRSTVARDMEHLQGESKPLTNGDAQGELSRLVSGYEDRVQKLTEMLDEKDLSKREKLAVIRTLNETGRQLATLRDKTKDGNGAKPWETEEARREWNAVKLEQLKKRSEEYDAKRRQEIRQEILAELREKGVEVPV
jgi:arginine repressor